MTYDSRPDTQAHIDRVFFLLEEARDNLYDRSLVHDQSKLESPEKEMFDLATEKLRGLEYGSEEYKQSLKDLGPALNHHYAHNSHHPEYYCMIGVEPVAIDGVELKDTEEEVIVVPELVASGHGINSMSLFDIIEMLVDWKASSERHATGDIYKSIEHNATRFGMSDQLKQIFINTAKEFGW